MLPSMPDQLQRSQLSPTVRAAHLGWAVASVVATFAGAALIGIACGLITKSGSWVAFGIAVGGAFFGWERSGTDFPAAWAGRGAMPGL